MPEPTTYAFRQLTIQGGPPLVRFRAGSRHALVREAHHEEHGRVLVLELVSVRPGADEGRIVASMFMRPEEWGRFVDMIGAVA